MTEKILLKGMNKVTYKQAIEKIDSLLMFGSMPGLERINKLLSLLGNPQNALQYVHVAGTNGKGSTCTMLSNVLYSAGYKTGLFISPYVIDFSERMQINGVPISHSELVMLVEEIFPFIEQMRENGEIITEFEFVTAIAFKWFSRSGCDIVVLETGLGGRLDSTNVIKTPLASVITSISLDHVAVLGDTLEQITAEKCGIIKPNGYTIYYPQQEKVNCVIKKFAAKQSNTLIKADEINLSITEQKITHTLLNYDNTELKLRLIGNHQVKNSKIVLATLELLRQKQGFVITNEQIADGFKNTVMPARLELLSTNPIILLDGAHNPDGMKALSQAIDEYLQEKKIVCIMGMLQDKDSSSALEYLHGLIDTVITLTPDNPRKQTAEELAAKAVKFFNNVYPMQDYKGAIQKAIKIAGQNGALVVCGSLYLAAQLRPLLLERKMECEE
ncbi:bifunctional folylpolyglutamate synthase/dihydrofolate synthase [Clostridia bacterium]|nr:bifunctional folylpolyglutamate synthase/dihydrofolate synthase [Clostridia bacterium]